MKKKLDLVDYLILIALLTTTLYVASNNLPFILGSFRFFWAPLTICLIIFGRPRIMTKPLISLLIIYAIVYLLIFKNAIWRYMDNWNYRLILEEFYAIFVFSLILTYYWSKEKSWKLAVFSKWLFVSILATMISTHIALFIDESIVRESANGFDSSPDLLVISNRFGAAGYGYSQAFVILIPIIVYFIKFKKSIWWFNQKMLVAVLILLILLILRSNVFANILVGLSVLVFSLVGSNKRRTSYFLISLIFIIFISVPSIAYSEFLISLSTYFPEDSNTYNKILDFAIFINEPEFDIGTDAGSRAARYPLLLEAFLQNPILGHASYKSSLDIGSGGHLYWMNKLTITGIIGFSFFIYVLYYLYKKLSSVFDNTFNYFYTLSVLSFICLGLIKNIAGREPWLMLILVIPGLYYLQKERGTT